MKTANACRGYTLPTCCSGSRIPAHFAVLTFAVFLSTALFLSSCTTTGENNQALKVGASIAPLADFCRRIGREKVMVETLIPAGANPHTFEPTSRQVKFLSSAKVFVYNGLGLETWAISILKKAARKDIIALPCAEAVPDKLLIETGACTGHGDLEACGEESSGAHSHGVHDPHVWLDPELALIQVRSIMEAFKKADPRNAAFYERNARKYEKDLIALDRWIAGRVSGFKRRSFVCTHPSLTYFARKYGLLQAGSIEEVPGKEPGVERIRNLVRRMKEERIKTVLVEEQHNPKAAEIIARETGSDVVVVLIDPIGNPSDPRKGTYVGMMKELVRSLETAMR